MDGLLVLFLVMASLALLGVAAILLGSETRPGFEDRSLGSDIAF
jgi:hypothetical protein